MTSRFRYRRMAGALADGLVFNSLIQPHEMLLLESVCCFGLCHGDASIVGDGEYLPELSRYDCGTGGRTAWCSRSRVRRSAPFDT
jgi:hypothetical protein